MTRTPTTFETTIELHGIRYTLFAELDVFSQASGERFEHFGFRGAHPEQEHTIEVTDWRVTDEGGHEVLDNGLRSELKAELGLRLIDNRETILGRCL